MARRTAVSRTPEQWAGIVKRWQLSGESVSAFARGAGLCKSSLYPWVRRLGCSSDPSGKLLSKGFKEVVVNEDGSAPSPGIETAPIEILTSRGLVVRVRSGANRETLRSVIWAAEQC
jgi:transposase-like protein